MSTTMLVFSKEDWWECIVIFFYSWTIYNISEMFKSNKCDMEGMSEKKKVENIVIQIRKVMLWNRCCIRICNQIIMNTWEMHVQFHVAWIADIIWTISFKVEHQCKEEDIVWDVFQNRYMLNEQPWERKWRG